MVALVGVHSLTFREFWEYEAPYYHGAKDLILSRMWLADVANAFLTNSFPKGAKARLASYLQKDRARDWWEEVGCTVGD